MAVFTGDSLFYGNVGRTDLQGREETLKSAKLLYNSLNTKLLPLGDGVIVHPAHGSGSACGASMSDIVISMLAYERATNHMLGIGQNEFIERKKEENIPLPPYFLKMSEQNLNGPPLLEHKHIEPMTASSFADVITECTVVDTRSPLSYAGGHIKGSYNIWIKGLQHSLVGYLITGGIYCLYQKGRKMWRLQGASS